MAINFGQRPRNQRSRAMRACDVIPGIAQKARRKQHTLCSTLESPFGKKKNGKMPARCQAANCSNLPDKKGEQRFIPFLFITMNAWKQKEDERNG